jgi:hypothetical protein
MEELRIEGDAREYQRGFRVKVERIPERPGWARLVAPIKGMGADYEILEINPIKGRRPPAFEVTLQELRPGQ